MSRAPSPIGAAPACVIASQAPVGVRGAQEQLDAVLAGVSGAADEHRRARHRALAGVQARRQGAVGELPHERAGPGALDREHREVGVAVEHVDIEPLGV